MERRGRTTAFLTPGGVCGCRSLERGLLMDGLAMLLSVSTCFALKLVLQKRPGSQCNFEYVPLFLPEVQSMSVQSALKFPNCASVYAVS